MRYEVFITANELALREEKIHQLSPHLISKADDFITDLLQ
jgi:hypothetical protein